MGVPKTLGKSLHKRHPKVRGPVLGNLVGILDGCVLHLPMDEGFGDTVHDRSGHGNHGTIYGATWTEGKIGRALRFDGEDDYVEVPDDDSLDITDEVSVFAWIKAKPHAETQAAIASKTRSGGARTYGGYYLMLQNGKLRGCVVNDNGDVLEVEADSLTDNFWHFVGFTYDGYTLKVYIDGVKRAEGNLPGPIKTNNLPLMIGQHSGGGHFNGTVDEARIYNRVRTSEEVLLSFASHPFSTPHVKGRVFLYFVSR